MKHYRWVAALVVMVCLWVGSNSAFAADLVWQTDKATAVSMAKAQGKKILLIAGRDERIRPPDVPGCPKTTYIIHTLSEFTNPPIKSLIQQNFIPWYVDVDAIDGDVNYYANYAGYRVYNLPLISVIDPYNSNTYLDRTTDAQPDVLQGFYTRLLQYAPCTYAISPISAPLSSSVHTGTVAVTTSSTCSWSAASNDPSWITITSGSAGTGNGAVLYSVSANTTESSRTGTMTIGGQTFTVTQNGSCTYTISPTSAPLSSSGNTGTVAVTTSSSCPWTAVSNASWITITAGSAGTGNGTVSYSVSANTTGSSRTGTMTIGGRTFTVTQSGSCTYTISPTSAPLGSSDNTGTVAVTTSSSCLWSAMSNDSWITITEGSAGTGNGTVSYSVSANTTGSDRTGTMTIGGETFTVNQGGSTSCTYTISPSSSDGFGSMSDQGFVNVTTSSSSCSWSAMSNDSWITVTSGSSGSGNGAVGYSVVSNSGLSRTGTITIGGQTFTINQASANAKAYLDTVQRMFIGYYQRPADPGGLIYYAGILAGNGGNINEFLDAFANSAESRALYGTISSSNISTFVNDIYNALFAHDAETERSEYYVNGFNSGRFTAATIMLEVLHDAQNEDLQSVKNKLSAANLFTMTIDPDLDGSNFQATYAGEGDVIAAQNFLAFVTSNSTTMPTQSQVTEYIRVNIANSGDGILTQ